MEHHMENCMDTAALFGVYRFGCKGSLCRVLGFWVQSFGLGFRKFRL